MSFASVVLTKDCIIVTSDGQLTDMNNLDALYEDYCKFAQLTNHQYMVCTGNVELMEEVYKLCKKKIKYPHQSYELKEMAIYIKDILSKYDDERLACQIIVCGFDKKNYPECYRIHSLTKQIESAILVGDDCYVVTMNSDYLNVEPDVVYSKFFDYTKQFSPIYTQDILEGLKEMHLFVAENDITVNDNIYYEIINRKYSLIESIISKFNR